MPRGRRFSGGRAGNHGSRAVLDNRPKQVLVTGYEEKDKDTVVAQFAVCLKPTKLYAIKDKLSSKVAHP